MILALKTDSAVTTLHLFEAAGTSRPLAQQQWESGRALSDELLGRIQEFLTAHGATTHNLTGIIIYSGPGSFTSLRIGHTVANALADALNIPVVGALGEDWTAAGLRALPGTPAGRPALPHYGAEANITRPKT
jgi:tRNA threonylcarbamoyladenosine biosynthesis protein TsaB